MKKMIWIFSIAFFLALFFFAFKILWPDDYEMVPKKSRENLKYWNLVNGSTIAYTFLPGNPLFKKANPIIYLHGGPGAGITQLEITTYEKFASEGFDVYLYDQVGCGYSNRLEDISDYTAKRHVEDLAFIIDSIGSDKVILAAQSWGSILALSYVAAHPARVSRIVITAPAPIQPLRKELATLQPPDSLHLRQPSFLMEKAAVKKASMRARITRYLARNYSYKLAGDKEADQYATWRTDELNKSMVCDSVFAVRAEGSEGCYVQYITSKSIATIPDHRITLKNLDIPVLILKAQCDNQPWGYTSEYLDIFKNHRFTLITDAGHNAYIEQPQQYVNAIVDFLEN